MACNRVVAATAVMDFRPHQPGKADSGRNPGGICAVSGRYPYRQPGADCAASGCRRIHRDIPGKDVVRRRDHRLADTADITAERAECQYPTAVVLPRVPDFQKWALARPEQPHRILGKNRPHRLPASNSGHSCLSVAGNLTPDRFRVTLCTPDRALPAAVFRR